MKKNLLVSISFLASLTVYSQNIPANVPTSGLLAWYPFSGNAVDSTGNGWDGTVNGAVLTNDRCGNPNSAYYFSDTSNITTLLLPPTGNNARTISCWFRYDSLLAPCNTNHTIVAYGAITSQCSNSAMDYSLEVCYTGMPPAALVDGTCVATYAGGPADTLDNNWHFFAAVYDTSYGFNYSDIKIFLDCSYRNINYYTDGVSDAMNTGNFSTLIIGQATRECKRNFWGAIDDIGVWDRALDSTELAGLCTACAPTHARSIQNEQRSDVYPNPAGNKISIRSGSPIKKAEILGITGQLILSQEFDTNKASLDISAIDPGIYFIRINGTEIHKLVKQ